MIIIYEPHCMGFEHAEVNAALLRITMDAFPGKPIRFLAEPEHLVLVAKSVGAHPTVTYDAIPAPARWAPAARRLLNEMVRTARMLRLAARVGADKLIVASTTTPGMIALKLMLPWLPAIQAIVIPHSILQTLALQPANWFSRAISFGNTPQLRYLVLGPSLRKHLLSLLPALEPYTTSIDMPYLYKAVPAPIASGSTVCVGAFGVVRPNKGLSALLALAAACERLPGVSPVEFALIGPVADSSLVLKAGKNVRTLAPGEVLSRADYDHWARQVDYAIFLYDPGTYRLVASAAFFDAIHHAKPIIALRNDFFAHYFDQLGDIGYLCDSLDEVQATLKAILSGRERTRQAIQRTNLIAAHDRLGPAALIPALLSAFAQNGYRQDDTPGASHACAGEFT